MIKKVANSIIVVILLISTSGVIINKHYSNGQLYSSSLFTKAKSCCEADTCCHSQNDGCTEETKAYRLVVDFDFTNKVQIDPSGFANLIFAISFVDIEIVSPETSINKSFLFYIDPPPLLADIPVKNCSFLL
ncbi:MAG: hypothetical protein K9H64_02785 [Bacteroidales bacterium]|nr:hypothetical protein [Bacteroidales bacterium]MCF8454835.1 hypothetical protein [Bacteroidales bacterium]